MKCSVIISSLLFFLLSSVSKAQCVEIDSLIVSNVNCDGLGSIDIVASKGSAPYYYSIDGGNSFHFSNLFTDLKKGSYEVFVLDGNNCSTEQKISITELLDLDITLKSKGNKLIANIENAAYRWFDCNNDLNPINGANENSYSCQKSGPYKVEVSLGNCIDTSVCQRVDILNNHGLFLDNKVNRVKHLNDGSFLVQTQELVDIKNVSVVNILGSKTSFSVHKNLKGVTINIDSQPGIYFLVFPNEVFKIYQPYQGW